MVVGQGEWDRIFMAAHALQDALQIPSLPFFLRVDLNSALESLRQLIQDSDEVTGRAAPAAGVAPGQDGTLGDLNPGPPQPGTPAPRPTVGISLNQGRLHVTPKREGLDAYARTLQDLLNILQQEPVGGIAELLIEAAARVEALEIQVRSLITKGEGEQK